MPATFATNSRFSPAKENAMRKRLALILIAKKEIRVRVLFAFPLYAARLRDRRRDAGRVRRAIVRNAWLTARVSEIFLRRLCRKQSLASLSITPPVGIFTDRSQRWVCTILAGQAGNANRLDVQGEQLTKSVNVTKAN